jgi:hypothetical protein
MLVGPIPRHEVEQWPAASFPGHAAAHCCAGAALPFPSTWFWHPNTLPRTQSRGYA